MIRSALFFTLVSLFQTEAFAVQKKSEELLEKIEPTGTSEKIVVPFSDCSVFFRDEGKALVQPYLRTMPLNSIEGLPAEQAKALITRPLPQEKNLTLETFNPEDIAAILLRCSKEEYKIQVSKEKITLCKGWICINTQDEWNLIDSHPLLKKLTKKIVLCNEIETSFWTQSFLIHTQGNPKLIFNKILNSENDSFTAIVGSIDKISGYFVQGFPNIQDLELRGSNVTDLSFLSSCVTLKSLSLPANQIQVLKPLSLLNKITCLDLYYNQIEDISALSHLEHLEQLILSCNQIKDVSPLSNLNKLKILHIDSNQIETVKPLSTLVVVQAINARFNPIVNPYAEYQHLNSMFPKASITLFPIKQRTL